MTAILIVIIVLVSLVACILYVQWDKEKIVRQAMENPYDCNKRGHRFEAQYDEEYAPVPESRVMQISTSCIVNQSDFENALLISSRTSRKYICHVCPVCGKTDNKGQEDEPA